MTIFELDPPLPYGPVMLMATATLPDCGFSAEENGITAVDIPDEAAAQLDELLLKDGFTLKRTDREEL